MIPAEPIPMRPVWLPWMVLLFIVPVDAVAEEADRRVEWEEDRLREAMSSSNAFLK